ncbi:MAG: hypothetical protein EAX96_16780 [Candidatus Lokiarchaeota archaeon]|nr:hypothetical protein [Candidatus Lokiarchaeota archaeon]
MDNLADLLRKLQEIVYVVEKDFSGVRLRSTAVLMKEELKDQINMVIKRIQDDVEIVEKGINPLRTWFQLRKEGLNAITNLGQTIQKLIEDNSGMEEVSETLRMFAFSQQEDFAHSILKLEKLWAEDIADILSAMKRVTSIMQVTMEKIDRYKQEIAFDDENLENHLEGLLEALHEGNFDKFNKIYEELNNTLIRGE